MSTSGAPVLACVRVGPLAGPVLAARWPRQPRDSDRCGGNRAVTGTLLVAHDHSPARFLETADIIVTTNEAGSPALDSWLRRYPGCTIAVSRAGPGECSVATRTGFLRRMAVSGPSVDGTLACGVFVHGWLAAGWPLSLLQPARLEIAHDAGEEPPPEAPLFFRFGYCSSSGRGPEVSGSPTRRDSASRVSRASGEPSLS